MVRMVWPCSGSPRKRRASRAVMNGVAPNISSTLATGARPSARMKATKLPASSSALNRRARPALRTSIHTPRRCQKSSGNIVATSRAERQNDTSQAGRSMRRTMTPAVLKTAAAPTAYATPSRAELCGGSRRFHRKRTVNTDSTCPRPSIPSNCRPSSRAFRGGARTCRRSRCCSAPTRPTWRRTPASACVFAWPIAAVTFWWACSTGRPRRRPTVRW